MKSPKWVRFIQGQLDNKKFDPCIRMPPEHHDRKTFYDKLDSLVEKLKEYDLDEDQDALHSAVKLARFNNKIADKKLLFKGSDFNSEASCVREVNQRLQSVYSTLNKWNTMNPELKELFGLVGRVMRQEFGIEPAYIGGGQALNLG